MVYMRGSTSPRLLSVIVLVLLLSLAVCLPASATPVSFDWGSYSSSGSSLYGVYDADGVTPLATGDLVQLIWVGPDGMVDPPDMDGTPGGDDVQLSVGRVENGGTLPPPLHDKGYVPLMTYTYDDADAQAGHIIYARAWNDAVGGQGSLYGNSVTGTLSGYAWNIPRWHVASSSTEVRVTSATAKGSSGGVPVLAAVVGIIGLATLGLVRRLRE